MSNETPSQMVKSLILHANEVDIDIDRLSMMTETDLMSLTLSELRDIKDMKDQLIRTTARIQKLYGQMVDKINLSL